MKTFNQIDELITIEHSGHHHAIITLLVRYNAIWYGVNFPNKDNSTTEFTAYHHSCYCLINTESLRGTMTDVFTPSGKDLTECTTIILYVYSFGQWKLKKLVKSKSNRMMIISVTSKLLHWTTQTKFKHSINAGSVSNKMITFVKIDRMSLDNCSVVHDFCQEWNPFLACISLNGTENFQKLNVWKVNTTSNPLKYMFSVNNKSSSFNVIIKRQNTYAQFKATGYLPSEWLTLFSGYSREYMQPSISLVNGYRMNFFKKKSVKVN